jgi:ribulose-phosphate 3-epimerase
MNKLYSGIAPSILAADFSKLAENVQMMMDHNVTMFHFDIMDGHFVPNLSFGPALVHSISSRFSILTDVHLMIEKPQSFVEAFIQAGADVITFHIETVTQTEAHALISQLRLAHVQVGISLKPDTPVDKIVPFLPFVDLVLVMSVEPGFGGQKFIGSALDKIKFFAQYRKQHHLQYFIEVDGGIDSQSGPQCRNAGVDILVAGSYLFQQTDLKQRLSSLEPPINS